MSNISSLTQGHGAERGWQRGEGGHDGPPLLRRKTKRRPAVRGAASGAHFQVLAFLTFSDFAASSAVWKRFLAFFLLCFSSSSSMRTTSSLSLLLLSPAA